MAAGKYNFIVEQGSQHEVTFNYANDEGTGIDLTGYRIRMGVKDHITDVDYVYRASSDASVDVDYEENFTLLPQTGSTLGSFKLTIPSAVSDGFTFNQGVYDIELVNSSGAVTRILEGKFKIKPQVTD